ncbi:sodium:solute symporter [bacterium]|nr:sodium:solute symporter [bacterium]
MGFGYYDWAIVLVVLGLMIFSVWASRHLMRSVADFLAAGRTAGRYLVSISSGIAGLGAITIVGTMEMNLVAGFSMSWWGMTMGLIVLIITVSGWVIYRFRQTRSLTLAQFFEARYSRSFRIFTGLISFISGLINFGIFPAVGARFFIYFCGLPQAIQIGGFSISTFPVVMIVLLSISLYFVFSGGQIAVIIGDFFQGVFVNIVFVILLFYVFFSFDWSQIYTALVSAPQEASLINPFKTSHVEDFNFWYFFIGIVGVLYSAMSWQGTQGYNASATSAHEAKMAGVLAGWRGFPQTLLFMFIPIVAYTVLNHPDFSGIAAKVGASLSNIDSEALQSQLRVPLVLTHILPRGLLGAFAAVMLAAFISTHDSYLHSWGSILVQDVIMPFRKRAFSSKAHLLALRLAIGFVALFIFLFSLLFKQSEYIFLFFAITGAIFAGGSGAVIIGGLYWKRGTAAAAWTAMFTGSTIAVTGILIHRIPAELFTVTRDHLPLMGQQFWTVLHWLFEINGQAYWALGMLGSSVLYVIISLLSRREPFNLDRLLKRGDYAVAGEMKIVRQQPEKGWRLLGMGREFTRGDKFIYLINYIWTGAWTIVFITGTIYNLHHDVTDETWMQFWRIFLVIHLVMTVISIIWFTTGGFIDLKRMIRRLQTMNRDHQDDGFIKQAGAGDV